MDPKEDRPGAGAWRLKRSGESQEPRITDCGRAKLVVTFSPQSGLRNAAQRSYYAARRTFRTPRNCSLSRIIQPEIALVLISRDFLH